MDAPEPDTSIEISWALWTFGGRRRKYQNGALAQLVERALSMREVRDSNSLGSTFFCANLTHEDPSRQNALLLSAFGHHPLLRGWLGNPARSVRCFCGALAHF